MVMGIGILVALSLLPGCEPTLSDDPIPVTPFPDVFINLSQNLAIKTDGGYTYINDAGVRGIIVYRVNASSYLAFERNCSYRPNDACSTVDVDISGLYMIDPCCQSTFSFSNGLPTGGPAWRQLRQYETILAGNELIITDEIIQ